MYDGYQPKGNSHIHSSEPLRQTFQSHGESAFLFWNLIAGAFESLTDYLHRNKEQENGMFGRAAAWMEGILTMMDGFTDAAADENAFSYPARDENDRHLDSRFNDVLDQYPQASA